MRAAVTTNVTLVYETRTRKAVPSNYTRHAAAEPQAPVTDRPHQRDATAHVTSPTYPAVNNHNGNAYMTELDADVLASIGTVGDSYDNAMAESVIGLYKTECVEHEGPWSGVDDLELATLNWVWWFNTTRLHSSFGYVPQSSTKTSTTVTTSPNINRCWPNQPATKAGALHLLGAKAGHQRHIHYTPRSVAREPHLKLRPRPPKARARCQPTPRYSRTGQSRMITHPETAT